MRQFCDFYDAWPGWRNHHAPVSGKTGRYLGVIMRQRDANRYVGPLIKTYYIAFDSHYKPARCTQVKRHLARAGYAAFVQKCGKLRPIHGCR